MSKEMSITELANKAFISRSYLSDIERGRTMPSLDKLNIICENLDISLSDFFAGVPELPADLIRLVENVQQSAADEMRCLCDLLDAIVNRKHQHLPDEDTPAR